MSMLARVILLVCAALCGGFIFLSGVSVSYALEPEEQPNGKPLFWFLASALVSAPFWIPALIPSRYPFLLRVGRWAGAVMLLFPTMLFGSIVRHNVSRSISGLGATPSALILGLVLTAACLASIAVLVWPELGKKRAAPANT